MDKLIASVQQEAGADLPRANEEKLEGEIQKEEEKVKKVAVEA